MSLKAKTLVQIIRENCVELYNLRCRDCIGQCEFEDSDSFAGKWIEVDDVEELEQKVKNLETDRDNLLKSLHTCTQNLNSYAKELAELKQKLRARAKTKPTQTLQSVRGSGDISLAYKICKAEAKQKMG